MRALGLCFFQYSFPLLKRMLNEEMNIPRPGSKETANRAVTAENTLLGVSLSL